MFFGKSYWKSQEQGIQREWLLTNGIGGFSSGTIIGMNARRYHGLLVASLMPPVERYLVLSNISESVHWVEAVQVVQEVDAVQAVDAQGSSQSNSTSCSEDSICHEAIQHEKPEEFFLHSFRTPDFQGHGEHFLEAFHYEYIPEFQYRIGSMTITKKICMRYGMNQVAIVYHMKNQPLKKAVVRLAPIVNYRNYHYLSCHRYMTFTAGLNGRTMEITPYDKSRRIYIGCSQGEPILQPTCYFYNMDYPIEHERGLNGTEDHYIPGRFEIEVLPGEEKTITLLCSIDEPITTLDGEELIAQEVQRQNALLEMHTTLNRYTPIKQSTSTGQSTSINQSTPQMNTLHQNTLLNDNTSPSDEKESDPFLRQLLLAVDKFIVYRKSTDAKTIIAGYPWFTDWGRDTMIALPGLTLAANRFEDARDILYTFAQNEKDGLIPNVFPDGYGEPAYNTVDAALWYFEAAFQYLQYTKDIPFIQEQLLPVLERIIQGYKKGTAYQIKMDKDALISAGNEDTQLTWMDAKAGSWVVTPRHGKAVEINALWYNALMIMSHIYDQTGGDGTQYRKLAVKVKKAFLKVFWNEKANCLYDVVNEQGPDEKIRPNQILALSLSFPLLEGDKAKSVVDAVHELLYTALGLRTLSQKEPQYRGIYIGDQFARDGAYHQGTVWAWPLGRFITAYARVHRKDTGLKQQLLAFFKPFQDHLLDACIGNISEIFDGNEPLLPRGCCAQAWSVSEILRAYIEDYLPLK